MRKIVIQIFKVLIRSVLLIFSMVIIYLLIAVVLSVIPVNSQQTAEGDISIYLLTNGVHTDLVVPLKNEYKDWSTDVKLEHIRSTDTSFKYLGFGWGDKAFYIETPYWSDLKLKTAFNAVFGLGPSAMHATFFKVMPEDEQCIKLSLTAEEYVRLINFIHMSFDRDRHGNPQNITFNRSYGYNDAFYEAKGRYNLFKTCNTWTNKALKMAGQKACVWTPFDKGIFWHYH